ncbi:hypothetical protein NL676_037840 [Syzygium grande]|nr:hypothetical protein NL676_037840 [Syzygium grande]
MKSVLPTCCRGAWTEIFSLDGEKYGRRGGVGDSECGLHITRWCSRDIRMNGRDGSRHGASISGGDVKCTVSARGCPLAAITRYPQ